MNLKRPNSMSVITRASDPMTVLLKLTLTAQVACLCWLPLTARPADVLGYSVLKGQFLNQTGADELVLDPDFGFSLLVSVDLTDFDLLEEATLRLPDGEEMAMDNLGDSWDFLDSAATLLALNEAYTWGDYVLLFNTINDGGFSCLISLPESPLPPTPRLVNFADVQAVDPGKPLKLVWDFDAAPESNDFVQVYVNLGHAEVFSTPNLGSPGALDGTSRSATIPAGTLEPGWIHSLNLEITRLVSTNADCYPHAEGVGATFRSTSVDVSVLVPPVLRLMSQPTNGVVAVEVRTEPQQTVVLQASADLEVWSNVATNTAPSGTNVFNIPLGDVPGRFFKAWQP